MSSSLDFADFKAFCSDYHRVHPDVESIVVTVDFDRYSSMCGSSFPPKVYRMLNFEAELRPSTFAPKGKFTVLKVNYRKCDPEVVKGVLEDSVPWYMHIGSVWSFYVAVVCVFISVVASFFGFGYQTEFLFGLFGCLILIGKLIIDKSMGKL